jgi:DNA ligase (NAD+)
MKVDSEVKSRVLELHKVINEHSYNYHSLDNPTIEDSEYDALFNELLEIEAKYPSLSFSYSPTQRVGSEPLERFNKVDHLTPMLSLENAFNTEDLEDFNKRIIERLISETEVTFSCEPKLDGIAVNLIYKKGYLHQATTRGDGKTGEDITHNIRTIPSIPLSFRESKMKAPSLIEIRGEVFIDIKGFKEVNNKAKDNSEKVFANPRNAAAGSLRQLDPKVAASRPLKFFAHGIGSLDYGKGASPKTQKEVFDSYVSWGLPVNPLTELAKDINECISYFKKIKDLREQLPYEIDGVVFKVNSFNMQESLGQVSRAPRWAIARKFPAEVGSTKVKSISFQVGRVGSITPVAEFEPLNIGGVVVSHASIHNFDEIERLDVREGDAVQIKRAGDVIPQIIRVDLSKRKKDSKRIEVPNNCPSCNSKLIKLENEAILRCNEGTNCPAQKTESIRHYVSRNALNIDGLGEKIIELLVQQSLISDFSDLYTLEKKDLLELEGFAEKSASKLLASIENTKETTLSRFIYALGIREVGEATALNLSLNFQNIDKFMLASKEELIEINDIGPIATDHIFDFLSKKDNQNLISKLLKLGIKFQEVKVQSDNLFSSKVVVITGSFTNIARSQLKEELIRSGARVSSSVSSRTDYLVAGEKPGSKLKKAVDLEIEVLDEDNVLKILKQ